MQIAYYVKRYLNAQQMLVSGPFKTKKEATAVLKKLHDLDVTKCPPEFIRSTNFDFGRGFFKVAKFADRATLPKSWLGSEKERFEEKNVI